MLGDPLSKGMDSHFCAVLAATTDLHVVGDTIEVEVRAFGPAVVCKALVPVFGSRAGITVTKAGGRSRPQTR